MRGDLNKLELNIHDSSSTSTSSSSTTTSATSTSSTITSSTITSSSLTLPPLPPAPPPDEAAAIGAALGTTLGVGLAVGLGVGVSQVVLGVALFLAEGSLTLSSSIPLTGTSEPEYVRVLKKTIAELSGPKVSETAVDIVLNCAAAGQRLLRRRLQDTVPVCFQVRVRGRTASTSVCQRLSGFTSSNAQRVLSDNLEEIGVSPTAVQVVNWQANANPSSFQPGGQQNFNLAGGQGLSLG
ncbi:unnamed protein product [Effrenium voratum]|nr:unnamed protein product [Effrenium voratum]